MALTYEVVCMVTVTVVVMDEKSVTDTGIVVVTIHISATAIKMFA